MKKLLPKFFYPFLTLILVGVLAWKNYVSGTILSGWDSLHPEFNFGLYLQRIFYGVWQEHQGVGAVTSQSHMAELSRLPILWLESLVLPTNLIRYSFFFICLALGAIGVYFLSKYILQKFEGKFAATSAFITSVFYILNLTTVQQFSVPLEMFAVCFATVPWLFYWVIRFLRERRNKNLFWFSVVTIFSSGMAHTATLYYVYIVCLGLFLLSICIFNFRNNFKKSLIILAVTFLLNSYWILPNLYFIKNHSLEVANSKINSGFSDEAFLQSKNYGDFNDLVLQKNFLFNWRAFDYSQNKFTDLMGEWSKHLENPVVQDLGYGFFALSVFGFLFAIIKKEKYLLSFFLPLILCVVFWMNANGPLTPIFEYLRTNSVLFREGLRFPFTKFSIIYVFILSLYLGLAVNIILKVFHKIKMGYIATILVLAANIYFALPAFKGYLIEPNVKVAIPNEYFQMFGWFSRQDPSARVAKLPMNTVWGWNYYSWHYEGGGFTWFGIPQPTFDREFDRWSHYNEDFYTQSSLALYSNNLDYFVGTLNKYQVKYLLLDESVINPGQDNSSLRIGQIKNLIAASKNIKEVTKFGFLTVYDTGLDLTNGYLSVPKSIIRVNANLDYAAIDNVYKNYGDYIYDPNGAPFPFVNFSKLGDVKMSLQDGNVVFENIKTGDRASAPAGKTTVEDLSIVRGFKTAYNCDLNKLGTVSKIQNSQGILYKATDDGVSCDYLNYPDFPYTQAYVLHIAGENKAGRSLKIYFYNQVTGRMDLEEVLPNGAFDQFYFVYPKNIEGSGYTLNFETRSFGRISSENLVSKVEFYPVELPPVQGTTLYMDNNLKVLNVQKYGTWAYKVDLQSIASGAYAPMARSGTYGPADVQNQGLIQLGQGYDPGWMAIPTWNFQFKIYNFQLNFQIPNFKQELEHKKINSWANGWVVPPSNQVTNNQLTVFIVFWPQLLEWGGGILGAVTLLTLVFKKGKFSQ